MTHPWRARYDRLRAEGRCVLCGARAANNLDGTIGTLCARHRQQRTKTPTAAAPDPPSAIAPQPSAEASTFERFCVQHNVQLVGLDCPAGHRSGTEDASGDEEDAWRVVHVATGRVAATVRGEHVKWEAWFEARFEDVTGKLTGRRLGLPFPKRWRRRRRAA